MSYPGPASQSDNIPHWLVIRGAALVGGVLTVQAARVGCVWVFGQRADGAVEAEGVEEGKQEQQADNAKNDDDQDAVHLHVHLLPWEQCGGGQEAGGRLGSIEPGWRSHCGWLHGGQEGDFWHAGRMRALSGLGLLCSSFKEENIF